MDAHTVIEDWESEPFDGGLAALGTRGFNGAIEAVGTWLFLRDGDPIAVLEDLEGGLAGEIDALKGASGRRHAAPDTASATLAAMLALGGEVRGRYFSDDTPLSAVHDTLSEGGFTGYVELSENVLSGDYYYVYVEGAVEHVGFVGSGRHVGGEEAKRKAEDEVGIYAVVAVSLEDLELPAPASGSEPDSESDSGSESEPESDLHSESDPDTESGSTPTTTLGGDEDDATDAGLGTETDTDSDTGSVSSLDGSDPDPDPGADEESAIGSGSDPGGDSGSISNSVSDPDSGSAPDSDGTIASDAESRDGADTESTSDSVSESPADGSSTGNASTDGASTEPRSASDGPDARDPSTDGAERAQTADTERDRTANAGPNGTGGGNASPSLSDSASPSKRTNDGGDPGGIDGLETRQVPSLDPERSSVGDGADTDIGTADAAARSSPKSDGRGDTTDAATPERSQGGDDRARETDSAGNERTAEGRSDADAREREERIAEYEARIEDLESRVAEREERIQELNAELQSLRTERDDLKAELEAVDAPDAVGADAEMTPTDALAETSLFVRERTRGEDTLADAHDGRTDREAVAKNVHIEHHATFDSEAVTVEGEPFEAWLEGSDPYAFVEWLVTELLFEIRSTGATEGLGPLYDALPAVDRIGFGETLTAGSGTEGREITFDIVLRDRKGNPLVVAHYDQDRDPTYAETIEPFVADCSDVCEANGTLAAAMVVTSSYFEADAMQATEEATSTSLLSRSTHRSYVKLSRSSGYHLCLIEARDGSFNLTVPEL